MLFLPTIAELESLPKYVARKCFNGPLERKQTGPDLVRHIYSFGGSVYWKHLVQRQTFDPTKAMQTYQN